MNAQTMLKGAFLTFCLIGMLAGPAAAAANGQATNARGQVIDQNLKDELWSNHQQYRLQRFDLNVRQADSVIKILNNYGIDTSGCQSTLSTIISKRATLETALTNRDRQGLQTINAELRTLWHRFRMEIRDAIKAHYRTIASAVKTPVAGSLQFGSMIPAV